MSTVLILGGGISGLSAAMHLAKADRADLKIVVLEAEDRLGGRIHTIERNGKPLEMGAQWIHGRGGNPLWKFVNENKIPIHPETNRDGDGIYIRPDDGAECPAHLLQETIRALDAIHDACCGDTANGRSVGAYITEEYRIWLEKQGDTEEDRQWRERIFDWFIKWEECDAGCDDLWKQSAISWGEYQDYNDDSNLEHGYSTVLEKMVELCGDSKVEFHTSHAVKKVCLSGPEVKVTCQNGKEFLANSVIVTFSLGYLKKWHRTLFEPMLPDKKVQFIDKVHFGNIARMKLNFDESFWDSSNPGFQILNKPKACHEMIGALTRRNWTDQILGFDSVINHPNMIMAWISGEASRSMETLSNAQIGSDLCDLLRKLTTLSSLPKLSSVDVTRWHSNQYHRGSYSYRTPECDSLNIQHQDLSDPIVDELGGMIQFAGEATHPTMYGTAHGAFEAGRREAERIIEKQE